jgi:hypothetical protein
VDFIVLLSASYSPVYSIYCKVCVSESRKGRGRNGGIGRRMERLNKLRDDIGKIVDNIRVCSKVANILITQFVLLPISVAARSKAYVFGHFVAGIACSNTAEGTDVCLLCLCRPV